MNLPRVSPAVMLCAFPVSMTLFSGCADAGSLAHRDDGRVASDMLAVQGSPGFNYNNRVSAEMARLMQENPKLSREDAVVQARRNVERSSEYVSNTTSSAEEAARKRKAQAQDKFEDDLAKTLKGDR
jgi:hypothetical protein